MRAYGFVDGHYVQELAKQTDPALWVDPTSLTKVAISQSGPWPGGTFSSKAPEIYRVSLYDAIDPEAPTPGLQEYLAGIDARPDCEVRYGTVSTGKRRQQKGVDVLLAVDMLVGAYRGIYDLAVLVAGDADFVPAVQEVRREGRMVLVVAHPASLSAELRRSADRVHELIDDLSSWPL